MRPITTAIHMNGDLFDEGSLLPFPPTTCQCNCGNGWCELHGTFHFDTKTEMDDIDRRSDVTHRGTHGGHRVIRKQIERD